MRKIVNIYQCTFFTLNFARSLTPLLHHDALPQYSCTDVFVLRRRHSMDEWDDVKTGRRRSVLSPCHSIRSSLGPPEVRGMYYLMPPRIHYHSTVLVHTALVLTSFYLLLYSTRRGLEMKTVWTTIR